MCRVQSWRRNALFALFEEISFRNSKLVRNFGNNSLIVHKALFNHGGKWQTELYFSERSRVLLYKYSLVSFLQSHLSY